MTLIALNTMNSIDDDAVGIIVQNADQINSSDFSDVDWTVYYGNLWDEFSSDYTGVNIVNSALDGTVGIIANDITGSGISDDQVTTDFKGDQRNAAMHYLLISDYDGDSDDLTGTLTTDVFSDDYFLGASRDSEGEAAYLGQGNDTVGNAYGGDDTLVGGDGDDSLFGGDDDDLIYGDYSNVPVYVWIGPTQGNSDSGENRDDVTATKADSGTNVPVYRFELPSAEDTSLTGDDFLDGGSGSDTLSGGAGDDVLTVQMNEDDQDILTGGYGNDTFVLSYDLPEVVAVAGTGITGEDEVNLVRYSVKIVVSTLVIAGVIAGPVGTAINAAVDLGATIADIVLNSGTTDETIPSAQDDNYNYVIVTDFNPAEDMIVLPLPQVSGQLSFDVVDTDSGWAILVDDGDQRIASLSIDPDFLLDDPDDASSGLISGADAAGMLEAYIENALIISTDSSGAVTYSQTRDAGYSDADGDGTYSQSESGTSETLDTGTSDEVAELADELGDGDVLILGNWGGQLLAADDNTRLRGTEGTDALISYTYASFKDQLENGFDAYGIGDMSGTTLEGRDGDDALYGGSGGDMLLGGDGADYIAVGAGDDTVSGGDDYDTIYIDYLNIPQSASDRNFQEDTLVDFSILDTIVFDTTYTDSNGRTVTLAPEDIEFGLSGLDNNVILRFVSQSTPVVGASAIAIGLLNQLNINNSSDGTLSGLLVDLDSATASSTFSGNAYDPLGLAIRTSDDGSQILITATSGFGTSGDDVLDASEVDLVADLIYDGLAGDDSIVGGSGDDSLSGGDGNDTIVAGVGADTLTGDGGADSIDAGNGTDSVDGGDGNDTILGGSGADTVSGGSGADSIDGGNGYDSISGGDDDDVILGGSGSDTISGGAGDDTVFGDSGDVIDGGDGVDLLSFAESVTTSGAVIDLGAGVAVVPDSTANPPTSNPASFTNFEIVAGTVFSDTISGDGDDNDLRGNDGNDILDGGAGDDTLFGDAGDDTLVSGDGADLFYGGDGFDVVTYEDDDEGLFLIGGVVTDGGDAFIDVESVIGTSFADRMVANEIVTTLSGLGGSDTLFGFQGEFEDITDGATLSGGDDDDLVVTGGILASESIDGGDGIDTVSYTNNDISLFLDFSGGGTVIDRGIVANLSAGTVEEYYTLNALIGGATGGISATDTLAGIENLIGGPEADTITGDDNDNVLSGGGNGDQIDGGGGDDTLNGNSGADTLLAGIGNDVMNGGSGDDLFDLSELSTLDTSTEATVVIDGGDGFDTVDFGNVAIDHSFTGGTFNTQYTIDGVTIALVQGSNVEGFIMGPGADSVGVSSDDTSQLIDGGSGNDTIFGGGQGADTLIGNSGTDTVDYSGADGALFDVDLVLGVVKKRTTTGSSGSSDTIETFENFIASPFDDIVLTGSDTTLSVTLGLGDDSYTGGSGDETVDITGGDDTVSGGDGTDTLVFGSADGGIFGDIAGGGFLERDSSGDFVGGGNTVSGFEVYDLTDFDDSLTGFNQLDPTGAQDGFTAYGNNGDDTLRGGTGDDTMFGDDGADFLVGGAGFDALSGGDSTDTLQHTIADASSSIDSVTDILAGQSGDDTFEVFNDGSVAGGQVVIDGGLDKDVLTIDTDDGIESNSGGILTTSETYVQLDLDVTSFDFGDAFDDVDVGQASSGTGVLATMTTVRSSLGATVASNSNELLITNVETLEIIADDDGGTKTSITGSLSDAGVSLSTVYFEGRTGPDLLDGSGMTDEVRIIFDGGAGSDTVIGGHGDDVLRGGGGKDVKYGGGGTDTFYGTVSDFRNGGQVGDFEDGETLVIEGHKHAVDVRALAHGQAVILIDEDGDGVLDTEISIEGDFSVPEVERFAIGRVGHDVHVTLVHRAVDEAITDGGDAGPGGDLLYGSHEADRLFGLAGDDTLDGNGGADVVAGGSGNDIIRGESGDDTLRGGSGADFIDGGSGNDRAGGGSGNDTLEGESGDDTLFGGTGDDVVEGGSGSDDLAGHRGNDTVIGDSGNDTLSGGRGNDQLDGGTGDDTLGGGSGDDFLHGGEGDDLVRGGLGDDILTGGEGDDLLSGRQGNDVLKGNAGDDTLGGGSGDDFLHGGKGDDLVRGGLGDDILTGGEGEDLLSGRQGNDVLWGNAGDDTLGGGSGDDFLHGGEGNDFIQGGLGDDILTGGEGDDLFAICGGGLDTLTDFELGIDRLELHGGAVFADLTFAGSDIILDGEVIASLTGVDTILLGTSDFLV